MTKEEYIEEIRIRLSNGMVKPENKTAFHPEFLARPIEQAINRVMYATNKDRELDYCSKVYKDVTVLYDDDLEKYYSALPEMIVQLPNNKGIRHISPMLSQEDYFVPISQQSSRVFNNLTSGKIARRSGYYLDGDKVIYEWFKSDIKKVLMKLIVPFSRLEDTDVIYVMENMDEVVFNFVLQYIGALQPEDKTNDDSREWTRPGS